MRPPAEIKNWLSVKKMFQWLQKAPDESSHKRRMAIWLTHTGQLHANKVADILNVSTQAVWLWIGQYNATGPSGLDRKGRGGRRWCYLTHAEESQLIKPFMRAVHAGKQPKPSSLKPLIEEKLGKKVSMPYIYRLLARHNWSETIAQSHVEIKQTDSEDDFRKYTQPWLT
jgi:transposase